MRKFTYSNDGDTDKSCFTTFKNITAIKLLLINFDEFINLQRLQDNHDVNI